MISGQEAAPSKPHVVIEHKKDDIRHVVDEHGDPKFKNIYWGRQAFREGIWSAWKGATGIALLPSTLTTLVVVFELLAGAACLGVFTLGFGILAYKFAKLKGTT